MKKIYLSIVFFVVAFVCSSCGNSSLPMVEVGQSMEEVEETWSSVNPEIDKDTYPNIWILKDYNILLEFKDNKVYHVYVSGATTNLQTSLIGYNELEGSSNMLNLNYS